MCANVVAQHWHSLLCVLYQPHLLRRVTWSAIRLVHKYEQDEYGEVCTPMEPNRVANMLVYIYGGFLLRQSPHLQDKMWDDVLTQKDLRIIRKEIMDWCVKNLPKDQFSTERVLDGLVWDEYGTY